ncbi:MAG: hypothetical protein VXY99_06470, partial [Pseudomonadota bacterium]|nr:hypothetical protein [Pseudomonadota bacterium]
MYGQDAQINRILQQAYEIGLKKGPDAMNAFLESTKASTPTIMDMLQQAKGRVAGPTRKLVHMADD